MLMSKVQLLRTVTEECGAKTRQMVTMKPGTYFYISYKILDTVY
jgi:hypothetical protein